MILEIILTNHDVNILKDRNSKSQYYNNVQYSIMKQVRDGINANPHC